MIASVRGEVLVRRGDHVVIESAGVGYRLSVSAETLRAVPAAGQQCFLHAVTIMRDDGISLYGFSSEEERDLFSQLIGVSGIGPKVAIATLSGGPHRELIRAIVSGDAKRFQEASARSMARDGLVNLGYQPLEAEQLLDGLDESDDAQQLIANALKRAGTAGRGE